jgi:hypothetical protein
VELPLPVSGEGLKGGVVSQEEVTDDAAPSKDQQIEYWMDKFFAEQDEKTRLLNQILAIEAILADKGNPREEG